MRDVYMECLVARKSTAGYKVLKVLCLLLAILSFAGAILLINGGILILFALIFGVATYFVNLYTQVDYEYIFVNGELTIDRILAKSKRKRLETYLLSRVEIIAPLNSPKLDGFKHKTYRQLDYTTGERTKNNHIYVMYYSEGKKLLLEPSKELVEVFRSYIPHKVHIEM